jgi:predicted nucleic acid-binding protein
MARLLLDTTVLIDALQGRPAARRILDLRRVGDVPLTSAINIEEVVRGLHDDERPVAARLFDGLRIVPIGRAEAERAGVWRRSFAGRGITLAQADCLVAAAAVTAGATLATANVGDFPQSEVTIEEWPVGA